MLRVTTLKATKASDVGALIAYYAGLALDPGRPDGAGHGPLDYYLDPDEPPGRWWGSGRAAVGVSGDVRSDEVAALLEGRHLLTGKHLGRRFREDGVRGFDATFSAPKSVSVLWALADDPTVRAEVVAAHDAAVEAALSWLERHGAVTRRGTDGRDQVDTRGLAVAVFRQHTSRTADPQFHSHALVFAKVQDDTGRWLSLDARFLIRQQRAIGWIYDASLRVELTNRLGVHWGPVVGGQADLASIPMEVCDAFSQRSFQVGEKLAELIRRWVDEHDGVDPDPRAISTLERRAVLASRPAKQHGLDAETLHAEWQERAREMGLEPESLSIGHGQPATVIRWEREAVIAAALERVSGDGATWLRADLAREIATMLPPSAAASGSELVALIDDLADEAAARCLELHPPELPGMRTRRDGRPVSEHVTDRCLTTGAVLDQESRLLRWAAAAATGTPSRSLVDHEGLDAGQIEAARAVAGTVELVPVVGPAGTGKTTSLAVAVASLFARDRPVIGLAPTGKAADVLAETIGCRTATVAQLLVACGRPANAPPEWRFPAGTTLIVDEASMVTTDDLDRLATLARVHGWRIALVGDPHQLPAVGRGGMFAALAEELPAAHLEEVRRFDHGWEAEASLRLRAGDPGAIDAYLAHDRIESAHPALVAERVARRYPALSAHGQEVAITTARAETARAVNLAVQRRRRHDRADLSVALHDGTRAHPGDRIATRRNARHLTTTTGVTVRNRHLWTVTAVRDDGSLAVSHPTRGDVVLPAGYVAEHVELGWAVTGYGTQGVTVDHAICVVEPGSSRAGVYVGMTRGRTTNTAVVIDPSGLQDPADTLARIVEAPPRSLTAHAMRRRLYERQGLSVEEPDFDIDPPVLQPGQPFSALERAALMRRRLDELDRSAVHREGPGLGLA